MGFAYEKYLREEFMPHIWCAGCGHGIIMKALIRAIDSLKLDKNKVLIASGIGCASRLPGYVDFDTLHTTHGRALAFATGVRLARPELTIIVVSGDGDAIAIGGNHFLHACQRNIDINLIIFNNFNYGMTGGQVSPSTPYESFTTTTPYGNPSHQFDVLGISKAAGATYVARSTAYHARHLEKMIHGAISHKGFSVVEVLEDCPTAYGRRNRMGTPAQMLKRWKDLCVTFEAMKKLPSWRAKDKIPIGLYHQETRPDFWDYYKETIRKAKEMAERELK